jgi:DNA-binding transcriptional ArsR family regulator
MVEQSAATLDAVFHALADSTRRGILRDLSNAQQDGSQDEGKAIGELALPYRMSLAAVSKHVQVLERARLVERRRRGQFQIVRLKPETLRTAQDWLSFYETFWTTRLDALEAFLQTSPAPGAPDPSGPAQKGQSDG